MGTTEISQLNWHSLSWQQTGEKLQTNPRTGLSQQEVEKRRREFGPNRLPEEKPPSSVFIFLRQFRNPLILILLVAGFVTFFFREYTDSMVIFGTMLLTTVIGYSQEHKAKRALHSLKKVLKGKGIVVREGNKKEIPQEDIVPGDIMVLSPGSKAPADGRIVESWNLKINEAILTGEWMSCLKQDMVLDPKTPLADRDNMVYMGSMVEEGNGKAIVSATGKLTELGKISTLLQHIEEEQTPSQKRMAQFSWMVGFLVSILAFLVFFAGIVTGAGVVEMFKIGVAIAVAAVPEGLPIALTIVLAMGMQRILKEKGLVRRLPSAETLGSTSVIATDKTLTLTEGNMEVDEICALDTVDREQILVAASLANEAFIENPDAIFEKWIVRGRPTDQALVKAAREVGISKAKLEKDMPLMFRIPFDVKTKYVASFHRVPKGIRAFISGAPESVLLLSILSENQRAQAQKKLQELTEKGLRVVGVAFKDIPSLHLKEQLKDVHFIGFIAFKDPLRKGVKEAIQLVKEAGVRTIMVTGDHVLTAKAAAEQLGLDTSEQCILKGEELDEMTDEQLQKRLTQICVYARVEPAHKLRIIAAWQERGEIIAMTGDGVNDAPALKKADVGIALGSGTDVAKDASDLILLGDKFSIIPAAIKEGRVMGDNMRKIITYMLSGSFTETILIGISIMVGAPFLPVTALQILWINLIEDILPGIALTMEKAEKDVMKRKPQKRDTPLLTRQMKTIIFVIGVITDFILLALFFWFLRESTYSPQHIQTIIFVGLGIASLFYVFSCRSLRKNIWEYNPFSNLYLVGSVLAGFLLLFAVIYTPLLQTLFHTEALNLVDWVLLFMLGIINMMLIEAAKWYFIRKEKS